jgi:transposase
MTQKEITRLRVINQTIDKVITIREAAELLGLSERQVIRLKKGVVEQGPAFIIHKNRGRKPQHTLPDEVRMKVVELKQTKYKEANFNHFVELLEEHEGIKVSYASVHRTLTQAGIKSPKKHRKRKSHHRRKRKPQRGMLVQIDASPYEWIIGGKPCNLHGAIDDATGEILALFFTPNECMKGYFEVVRRIEKLWNTLQSRLPVEFKIRGIDTIEAANAFLSQFIVAYNEKFAVKPENPEPAFRPLDPDIELDYILCIKEKRAIIEDSAFSYKGKYYQLVKNGKKATAMPKAKLTVLTSSRIGVKASYAGVIYDTLVLEERPKKKNLKPSEKQPQKRTPVKPAADHPWRQMPQKRPNFAYEETDREIIEMLNQLFNSTRAWA